MNLIKQKLDEKNLFLCLPVLIHLILQLYVDVYLSISNISLTYVSTTDPKCKVWQQMRINNTHLSAMNYFIHWLQLN